MKAQVGLPFGLLRVEFSKAELAAANAKKERALSFMGNFFHNAALATYVTVQPVTSKVSKISNRFFKKTAKKVRALKAKKKSVTR